LKEGVREEEGLGDADGEEEEEEEGKEAGRRCSAGHGTAPATGPWHAVGCRLCGLVCEVVGMGWDLAIAHDEGKASHEKQGEGGGRGGSLDMSCVLPLPFHTTALTNYCQRKRNTHTDTHRHTSTSSKSTRPSEQQNLQLRARSESKVPPRVDPKMGSAFHLSPPLRAGTGVAPSVSLPCLAL